jgi:hypothetical protein
MSHTSEERMKLLEDAIRSMELTPKQKTDFESALNAESLSDLARVTETTDHRTIQDYAIFKGNFWITQ